MAARATKWDEPKRRYLARILERTGSEFRLEGRGGRWASGPSGAVALLASGTRDGARWWFGLDATEFEKRQPRGLVLLCDPSKDGPRGVPIDFGLSRDRVADLIPRLGRDQSRGEVKLNLVHRGEHVYALQVPGQPDVDVTAARGDLSWLEGDRRTADVERGDARAGEVGSPSAPADERAFFARVRHGRLEPLDPTHLPEGALVRVRAAVAHAVPGIAALRRIAAAGGPSDLPADLAERHDQYAHGARNT